MRTAQMSVRARSSGNACCASGNGWGTERKPTYTCSRTYACAPRSSLSTPRDRRCSWKSSKRRWEPCRTPSYVAPTSSLYAYKDPPSGRKVSRNTRALKSDGASVDGEERPSFRMAQVALWSVPLLWASYNIVVRQLFDLEDAPHPATLTFYRSVIAAGAFAAAVGFGGSANTPLKPSRWRMLSWASFELGLWNFLGTAFQVVGLECTTATRGGFLLATCNVLVPLFAALSGQTVNPFVWLSCGMAALGAAVLSMDHAGGDVPPEVAEKLIVGDLAVLASSVFFAVATIRLEKHARENPNFLLVAGKTISMVIFALFWVLADGESWRHPIESIAGPAMKWEGNLVIWAMIAYSAVGPGGFAAWMQTVGQRQISASQAQAVYAMTPVFSAAMAPLLLSDNAERLGFYGYIGGGLLVVAGLVVGLNGDPE